MGAWISSTPLEVWPDPRGYLVSLFGASAFVSWGCDCPGGLLHLVLVWGTPEVSLPVNAQLPPGRTVCDPGHNGSAPIAGSIQASECWSASGPALLNWLTSANALVNRNEAASESWSQVPHSTLLVLRQAECLYWHCLLLAVAPRGSAHLSFTVSMELGICSLHKTLQVGQANWKLPGARALQSVSPTRDPMPTAANPQLWPSPYQNALIC